MPSRRVRVRRAAVVVFAIAAVTAGAVTVITGVGVRPRARLGQASARAGAEAVVPVPSTQAGSAGQVAPWVQTENAKGGSAGWRLPPKQHQGQIEGFADHVSAQQGDTVTLFVSTVATSMHVEAYRMGYYGGLGGRLIWTSPELGGVRQPPPTVTSGTNMVVAPWAPTLQVHIDSEWPQGAYLFKLVASNGQQQYIPLTVRDDQSHAAYLVQSSVTTWQAYNSWGGYDLYLGKHGTGQTFANRARIVSFDRPYTLGNGAGDFLALEYPLIALMEAHGLDVTYTTSVDTDQRPELLLNHKALFSLGHDEYWSTRMRDGFESARNGGVNLGFMGANAVYRHIRFAPSPLGVDRHIVDYKNAKEDPLLRVDPSEVTVNWREPPVSRPENSLIGDYYQCNPVHTDMVVVDTANWLFAGAGLHDGDRLTGVIGSEYDRYVPTRGAPQNVDVLAHSPLRCHGHSDYSDATYYSAPSGAGVFATGTIDWIPSLTSACAQCPGPALVRVTENLLAAFGTGPAGFTHPSTSNGRPMQSLAQPGGSAPVRRPQLAASTHRSVARRH